jgi:hypothetical protein
MLLRSRCVNGALQVKRLLDDYFPKRRWKGPLFFADVSRAERCVEPKLRLQCAKGDDDVCARRGKEVSMSGPALGPTLRSANCSRKFKSLPTVLERSESKRANPIVDHVRAGTLLLSIGRYELFLSCAPCLQ